MDTNELFKKCRTFCETLESQIEAFEKETGGKVISLGVGHYPDVQLDRCEVEFGRITVRAGSDLPF